MVIPALILIVLLSVLVFGMGGKRSYDDSNLWRATYSHADDHPFGMMLFDSIMAASLPNGYVYSDASIFEIIDEADSDGSVSLLFVNRDVRFDEDETSMLLDYASRGNKVLLVCDEMMHPAFCEDDGAMPSELADRLDLLIEEASVFSFTRFKDYLDSGQTDTVWWNETPFGQWQIPSGLIYSAVRSSEKEYAAAAALSTSDHSVFDSSEALVCRVPWGRGEVIVMANSLLFTNYAVLTDSIAPIVMHAMTLISDRPVVRFRQDPAVEDENRSGASPLAFLLSNRPLQVALYIALALLLLFACFSARRRQRVIPAMQEPENQSKAFAELIGSIYLSDNRSMVAKKYVLFANELRNKLRIDIADKAGRPASLAILSRCTGMSADYLNSVIESTESMLTDYQHWPDKKQMMQQIDKLNEILEKI